MTNLGCSCCQFFERATKLVQTACRQRYVAQRDFGQVTRSGFKGDVVIMLTFTCQCREQQGALLSQPLQTVVLDRLWPYRLELWPQMPHQDFVKGPLEQTQPSVGLH